LGRQVADQRFHRAFEDLSQEAVAGIQFAPELVWAEGGQVDPAAGAPRDRPRLGS
jgi:hypothetical protein